MRSDQGPCLPERPHDVRVPQNFPLFGAEEKSNDTEYCNVDALILLDGKIKVVVEIEESALGPTQVFGKFLSSAAARCYIHVADRSVPVHKEDDVLFVQIMDTASLKPRTSKREQWENIEASIRSFMPRRSIRRYYLLYGDEDDFLPPGQPAGDELDGLHGRSVEDAIGEFRGVVFGISIVTIL